jgi:hypothetical protein
MEQDKVEVAEAVPQPRSGGMGENFCLFHRYSRQNLRSALRKFCRDAHPAAKFSA